MSRNAYRNYLTIGLLAMAVLLAPVAAPSTSPQAQAADATQTIDVEAAGNSGNYEDCGNVTCTAIFSRSFTKQLVAPAGIVAAAGSWIGMLGKILGPVIGTVAATAGRAVMLGRCLRVKVVSYHWVVVGPVVGIGTDNGPRCHN